MGSSGLQLNMTKNKHKNTDFYSQKVHFWYIWLFYFGLNSRFPGIQAQLDMNRIPLDHGKLNSPTAVPLPISINQCIKLMLSSFSKGVSSAGDPLLKGGGGGEKYVWGVGRFWMKKNNKDRKYILPSLARKSRKICGRGKKIYFAAGEK